MNNTSISLDRHIKVTPQNGVAGRTTVTFEMTAINSTKEDKILKVRVICGNKFKDLLIIIRPNTTAMSEEFNRDFNI